MYFVFAPMHHVIGWRKKLTSGSMASTSTLGGSPGHVVVVVK
eukprot:CAMPEP_0115480736 /NCGR_PEP_ID=MMETSP0271-20121206/57426_1 /TAXON_ID=71861 /ORGANISM="Scrippsiella trochoidea, Strain CCMP3099" /LENGTH=41 /DNA_ID= /DNA_START= /DNA_END= /DNA_ORIENTATION=